MTPKNLTKKAIKSGSASGIVDNKAFTKVLVYPNPANGYITIPVVGNKTIILTDLNGKILKSLTTDHQVISLLDLAGGQYIITVLTNKNKIITTQKILKIK